MATSQYGNYRVERLLGKGGYAEIYLGRHIHLGTYAAIKILQAARFNAEEEEDFKREAQLIAGLDHPHIVNLLDFGMEDKTPYLVMQYAPKGSLIDLHPRGRQVPLNLISAYVEQVAEALQYAHDRNLIHRDVKPSNMLVKSNGDVLVSDFGLALASSTPRALNNSLAAGTPLYMAPEQIQGQPTIASDQYALAIVAYEWLTGKPPFDAREITQIFQQQLLAPVPSIRAFRADVSPELEFVLRRALAKRPEERYPSITDFARALRGAIFSGPTLIESVAKLIPPDPPLPSPPERPLNPTVQAPTWQVQPASPPTPVAPPPGMQAMGITAPLFAEDAAISVMAPPEQTGAFAFPPPPGQARMDFFISYTKADRVMATWVANVLRYQGFSVFLPPVDFRVGFIFQKEVQKAFTLASRMLTILSPDYSAALQSRRGGWKVFQRVAQEQASSFFMVCVKMGKEMNKRLFDLENYLDIAGDDEATAQHMLLAYVRQTSADSLTNPYASQPVQAASPSFTPYPPPFTPYPPSYPATPVVPPWNTTMSAPPPYPPLEQAAPYTTFSPDATVVAPPPTTLSPDATILRVPPPASAPSLDQTWKRTSPPVPAPQTGTPSVPPMPVYEPPVAWNTVVLPPVPTIQDEQQVHQAITVFVSYSHKDEAYRRELATHLSPLSRGGLIASWYDGEIGAGDLWEKEIIVHLQQAMLVLLLISPDFLNSQYCYEKEMQVALQRHMTGQAKVIPIIVRPSSWKDSPFSHLQVLPRGAQPISLAPNSDQAYLDVVEEIRKIVQQLLRLPPPAP